MKTLLLFLIGSFWFIDLSSQCPLGSVPSSQELVTNGNFSSGNVGFSSNYNYYTIGSTVNEGEYAIDNNARNVHPNFRGRDHTTGSGNFMIINGASVANVPVWCQTVSVHPNTVYLFSAWVSSVFASNPSTLQFSINGVNLGFTFNAPPVINQWIHLFISWNSGSDTSATICVVNQNTQTYGNDFALDDISFVECTCALTASAGPDTSFCPNDSVQLVANPSSFNYTWSTGSTAQTIFVNSPGVYWLVASSSFCADSDSVFVTSAPSPLPVISGDSLICNGEPASLYTGPDYSSYIWSNGETDSVISVVMPGNYSVTVTNNAGCTGSASASLTSGNISAPVIQGDSVFCLGDFSFLDAGAGYSSYLWSIGSTSRTVAINSSGIISVAVYHSGCIAYDSIEITALQPEIPVITGDTIICENDSTVLTAMGSFQNLLWNTGENDPSIYVNQTGTYSVITTDNDGCSSSVEINVTVNPNPEFIINTQSGCNGLDETFTASGTNLYDLIWTFGDGAFEFNLNPVTHHYTLPGNYTIMFGAKSMQGCVADTLFNLVVDTLSDVHAEILLATKTVLLDEPLQFQTHQTGQNSFEWDFGDGSKSSLEDPVYAYRKPGNFEVTLTVSNPQGCQSVDNTEVEVSAIYISNSFTPNGDGLNDVFKISLSTNIKYFSMFIFNRLGQNIYKSESPEIGWDGNVDGVPAEQGVYEFLVEIKNDEEIVFQRTGSVTLIR